MKVRPRPRALRGLRSGRPVASSPPMAPMLSVPSGLTARDALRTSICVQPSALRAARSPPTISNQSVLPKAVGGFKGE